MKKYLLSVATALMLLVWGSSIFGLSNTLTVPIHTLGGLAIDFDLRLQEHVGTLVPTGRTGTTASYSSGPYRIQVSESPRTGGSVIRVVVTRSEQPFWVSSFSVAARIPREPIQGVWYPSAPPNPKSVMAGGANNSVSGITGANYGIPYIAGAAANTANVFAMGLGRQDLPAIVAGGPEGDNYEFRLTANAARNVTVFDESFFVSWNSSMTWFDVAGEYAGWVDELNHYEPFPISANAYEPIYDTWYWSADHVDDRLYRETAQLAQDLGFGLYLADSGWDAPAGEYEKWLNGKTGDYDPPSDKFGDLPATFSDIRSEQKLGINLWLQPFAVGRESSRYAATRDLHIQIPEVQNPFFGWMGLTSSPFVMPLADRLETVNLCPRMAPTQNYLENLFAEMADRYQPDGYWIDFLDGLANHCVAPHEHTGESFGGSLNESLATIKRTVLSSNPHATVHFRAPYANLNTKSFANIWQSEDSPGDFERMRLNAIRMRPFSKGVVMASDQIYWPETTDEVQASKFIVTSVMTGVPAFGPDLRTASPAILDMIRAWLTFYRDHKAELAGGHFSPFGPLEVPNHKIEAPNQTFAYVRNPAFAELAASGNTIFLINATDEDHLTGRLRGPAGTGTWEARVLDRQLQPEANPMQLTVDGAGLLHFDFGVQQGGMVVLSAN